MKSLDELKGPRMAKRKKKKSGKTTATNRQLKEGYRVPLLPRNGPNEDAQELDYLLDTFNP